MLRRSTKDSKKEEKIIKKEVAVTKKNTTVKKSAVAKKATSIKKKTTPPSDEIEEIFSLEESIEPKEEKKAARKTATKNSTSKKVATKKTTTKKSAAKKSTAAKKTTTKTTRKPRTKKEVILEEENEEVEDKPKVDVVEYYDLPYRYNQTVIKILAQTPDTLFVYWDISDEDKEQFIKEYGEYFFNNTKPVLVVHNKTKNYSFEVDINDFANSWYLHIPDSNCDYQVELGRRPINKYVDIKNNYLEITKSNDMYSQNDHILIDNLSRFVYFRNVKTNETYKKDITRSISLLQKIGKFDKNVLEEFYKKLYPNEKIGFKKINLRNPSSGNPSSSFK